MAKETRPREFGRFVLEEHMGRGGMASVYRAIDSRDNRTVAVKIFKETEERGPEVVRRLRDREVRMLQACEHPNVVRFFESGDFEGQYFYVMEFVPNSLSNRMRHGPYLELREKVSILKQTAAALAAVHRTGVVHRDIKPGNILLDELADAQLRVKITDLGIAKNVVETDIAQTMGKKIPGTPKYLAPEQIKMQPVDGRADIFALGVTGYDLLGEEPPFKAELPDDYLKANCEQIPRPLHEVNRELPECLCKVVTKMLEKDREKRYDAETLCDDLQRVEDFLVTGLTIPPAAQVSSVFYVPPAESTQEPKKVPLALWLVTAAILAVSVVLMFYALQPLPERAEPRRVSLEELDSRPPPTADELLQLASQTAQKNRYWETYGTLGRIRHEKDLGEIDKEAFDKLERDVVTVLARPMVSEIKDLLAKKEVEDSGLLMARLQDLYPVHPELRQLESVHANLRRELATGYAKEELLTRIGELRGEHKYAEAFRLLVDTANSDNEPAVVKSARKKAIETINVWGKHLTANAKDLRDYQSYEKALEESRGLGWEDQVKDLRVDFWLARSAKTLALGQVTDAQQAAKEARKLATESSDIASAEKAYRECILRLRERPMSYADFVNTLKEKGFSDEIWSLMPAQGFEVSMEPGKVSIRGDASKLLPEAACGIETIRPIEDAAFNLNVSFRASLPKAPNKAETPRFMFEVRDEAGAHVQIFFKQDGYWLVTAGGRNPRLSGKLKNPSGQEAEQVHTMALAYKVYASELQVSVGGEPPQSRTMKLSRNLRIRLYVQGSGSGEYDVEIAGIRASR